MLAEAKKLLAVRVNEVYPGLEAAGRILHPDDRGDVTGILEADPTNPVVILHSPQLVVSGPVNLFTCPVSVCALTENAALTHADALLKATNRISAIAPTTFGGPDATVIREEGFWRAAISIALRARAKE